MSVFSRSVGRAIGAYSLAHGIEKDRKKAQSEYDSYRSSREKVLNAQYEILSSEVELFTTETANQEIFKVSPLTSTGVFFEDANFRLMEEAKKMGCNIVVGICYIFNEDEFGVYVTATGTIATTDKKIYDQIRHEKKIKLNAKLEEEKKTDAKLQEEEMRHEHIEVEQNKRRTELEQLLSKMGTEFANHLIIFIDKGFKIVDPIITYIDQGFKITNPIYSGVIASLYQEEEKELVEYTMLGAEKKIKAKVLTRIDVVEDKMTLKLKTYDKQEGKEWKFNSEKIVEKA